MPADRVITVDGLQVALIRKRIRNINLSVRGPEGRVRVSAPPRVSESEVRRFVASRLDWIRRHQARLAVLPTTQEPRFESGEQHPFMGRTYPLQITEVARGRPRVQLNGDNTLHLLVPEPAGIRDRQALIEHWYRQQLQQRIPALIARYERRMGVRVAEWRIRKMKTRWGTCNTRAARIWINLELAKYPPQCLEYIVMHEMTHLLERLHNARFYALMDQFMPDWRSAQAPLRGGVPGA